MPCPHVEIVLAFIMKDLKKLGLCFFCVFFVRNSKGLPFMRDMKAPGCHASALGGFAAQHHPGTRVTPWVSPQL